MMLSIRNVSYERITEDYERITKEVRTLTVLTAIMCAKTFKHL
eukprot:COSAG06_NODE_12818_length_1316_cov_10.115918_3_plen_42_part_01